MHVIGAIKVRLNPYRVLQFAFAAAFLRIDHAIFSTAWHIDGDLGIPWLMANDWEFTSQRRFYWGQSYLGTYETAVLAKLGHLFWPGTIPVAFNFILGQLLYVAGATFLFAAVRKLKPKFGDRGWEFVAALALLAFAVPGLAKYSFSVGTGYSLTPLVVGLISWLWVKESALQPGRSEPWVYVALGLFVGLAQSVLKLNVIPVAALALCLSLTRWKHHWPLQAQWRPWILVGGGLALSFIPGLLLAPEQGGPGTLALFPLLERFRHFFEALFQTGNALGTLPYATVQPEDALFFRGHPPEFAHGLLDWLSILALGALAYQRRADVKTPTLWIFWAILLVNLGAITFNGAPTNLYSARRYEFPGLMALSVLILLSLDSWLGRGLAALRAVGLLVYLYSSLAWTSPLEQMKGLLEASGFQADHDCLSGSGGDLSAVMALNGTQYTVISHKWRLAGNYSRAIAPEDLESIRARCIQIFHVDTGETPIEEVGAYCPGPRLIFKEAGASPYRPRVRLFGC